jgi:type VI secretion system protein ImpH
MAAASRTEDLVVETTPPQFAEIERLLQDHPGRFDFFQAVRLLLRLPDRERPDGRFVNPADEVVRYAAKPALAFPPSTIDQVQCSEGRAEIVVTFMGLTGPAGVLPRCYSAFLLSRVRERDHSLADFFDLFNHRIISLFYWAWEKYRFGVTYEREGADRLSKYLSCLIGLGTAGLESRLQIQDERLLFYAGLLSLQPRSATALAQLLEDYFDVPVEVEQFVGAWRALDAGDQCIFDNQDSLAEQLGPATVIGDAVWDLQSRIRLKLGPLTQEQYLSFLPSGTAWEPLCELTRFSCGREVEVETQLILEQKEVPRCDLGRPDSRGPRLGWFTWIRSGPEFDRPPGDTVLLLA